MVEGMAELRGLHIFLTCSLPRSFCVVISRREFRCVSSSTFRLPTTHTIDCLLNDEIRSRSKTNVVETKRFSERLEAAIARYHTNAVSTVEVLQELIDLAKEVRDVEQIQFHDRGQSNQQTD